MKVIYSERARTVLAGIIGFISEKLPIIIRSLSQAIRIVPAEDCSISRERAPVENRFDIRVVPLKRYPYKFYYQYRHKLELIEIVDIQHVARDDLPGTD
ncbi:hypothetical protein [Tardiphaga sp.]|uniref:hypothetical protein n=1 Tax=Tardiphaga sp. TaxID=1926292 RepID=UPI0025D23117|nr:hypothetical protein [Tardiphaga sp.]